jgi:transposase InsO family protein
VEAEVFSQCKREGGAMKRSRYTEEQIIGILKPHARGMPTRASAADTSLGSGRVTRVLERLIAQRGRPENMRSDNETEFTSRRMLAWLENWKVGLIHIQPGRPMQNGHVESFHGRPHDECLNANWFQDAE